MDRFLFRGQIYNRVDARPPRMELRARIFSSVFPDCRILFLECFRAIGGCTVTIAQAEGCAHGTCSGYIGGTTPLFPTTTRLELSVPSDSR